MSKLPLNYIPHKYKILVGDLNVTPLVENFSIQRPRGDIRTPYSWSGSLTLADVVRTELMTESLDDLLNPGRWAKGVHQVQFWFEVNGIETLFCTMRISEYFYNENEGIATLELADILSLLDFKTPAKDYKGLEFPACASITVGEIVTKALQEAGILAIAPEVTELADVIDVAPNKPDGSWITWAQGYLGERGYWLCCLPDEGISISRYPVISPLDSLLSRARTEVEDFERAQSPDIPVEKYICTASPEKFSKCSLENETEIEEEYGYILDDDGNQIYCLERRVTTTPFVNHGSYETSMFFVEQALGSAYRDLHPGNPGLVLVERTREKRSYDSHKRLILVERYSDKPLGMLLPDEFPPDEGYTYLVENIEATIEEFSEFLTTTSSVIGEPSQGVMRNRTKTTYAPFPIGLEPGTYTGAFGSGTQIITVGGSLNFIVTVKEKIVETWKGGGISSNPETTNSCTCDRYKYRKQVYQRNESFETETQLASTIFVPTFQLGALQLKTSLSKSNNDDTPPAWETQDPKCPTCTDVVKAEVTLLPVAYTSFAEREKEIQATTVQNKIEAEYLANLIGTLDWARYHQRNVSMPVPNEVLTNPQPFHRIDVHNGSFICDNPIITLGDDGMEFAFIGNYIGAIPEVEPILNVELAYTTVTYLPPIL